VVENRKALEQAFKAANYKHPSGNCKINFANNAVWKKALKPLLVDLNTAQAITGGPVQCSKYCLSEDGDFTNRGYQFVDNSRFKLTNCSHHSRHLQCIITGILLCNWCYTECPIRDSSQCRWTTDEQGKEGQAFYWAPEDYEKFAKAFFRNEKLVRTFLKPEFR